jgi:hypothetical protein
VVMAYVVGFVMAIGIALIGYLSSYFFGISPYWVIAPMTVFGAYKRFAWGEILVGILVLLILRDLFRYYNLLPF